MAKGEKPHPSLTNRRMNEYTVAETEAAPITHTKDSQYQLSKKVAQLIKVIVQLNVVNENYSTDKKRLIDAHYQGIKVVTDDSDARLKLLQDELLSLQEIKDEEVESLRELIAKNAAREADSLELLASIKREAKAEVEGLQRNHELELLSQAQTVRDISHSLEEQSRKNQEDVLRLRNELADEHKRHIENFTQELTSSHADEILMLKSRHEKNILRVKSELSEQGKLAVENAIAKTRLEYEERLSQQLFSCVKKCEDTKAEVIVIVDREKKTLEEELERMKLRANEIPILKERLDVHVGNEKKLQSEVTRLQNSLDSVSAINQRVVRELQTNNTELRDGLQIAHDAGKKRLERIRSLEEEVRQCVFVLCYHADSKYCINAALMWLPYCVIIRTIFWTKSVKWVCPSLTNSVQEFGACKLSLMEQMLITRTWLSSYWWPRLTLHCWTSTKIVSNKHYHHWYKFSRGKHINLKMTSWSSNNCLPLLWGILSNGSNV